MANDDALKAAAADSAVAQVRDGMLVGLGTGSTASFAIAALGRRVNQGLRIRAVPTSDHTVGQARALGIPLVEPSASSQIDLTIDGADQVEESTLNLVKGHGGALLREKIVASASRKLVIIIHDSKLVEHLGGALSVEVIPFGWELTAARLSALDLQPVLRRTPAGDRFRSDSGNFILDCMFSGSAYQLASGLDHVVGLVEHGLFLGLTSEVHCAGPSGVRILHAP